MFKPGQSGNPKGRKKGAKGKHTADIRANISAFISHNWPTIQQSYEKMDPEKQLIFFEKLLKYSVAPLQSINIQAELRNKLENLSEEQLKQLSEQILSPHAN